MSSSTYRPELDSLRAIAITIVMLHHYVNFELPFAGYGVMLFFALSGYFGTRVLLGLREHLQHEDYGKRAALATFYGRRYLRILPPHLLVVGLTALFAVPYARATWGWNLPFLTNIGMLVEGDWFGRFSPLWSLSLLEQFYLFWPALILFSPRAWLQRILLGAIGVALLYRLAIWHGEANGMWWLLPLPAGLDQLAPGALLALWVREGGETSRKVIALRRIGLFVGGPLLLALILGNLLRHPLPLRDLYGPLLISLFFVWLIDRALRGMDGTAGGFLRTGWLAAAGRVSYAAFLFHNFTELLLRPIPGMEFLLAGNWRALILVPCTFGLAQLSWLCMEKPIGEFRKSRFRTPVRAS